MTGMDYFGKQPGGSHRALQFCSCNFDTSVSQLRYPLLHVAFLAAATLELGPQQWRCTILVMA